MRFLLFKQTNGLPHAEAEPSRAVRTQAQQTARLLLFGYGLIGLVLLAIRWQSVIPPSILTRDPMAVVKQPFYVGFLSNVSILFWAAATTLCLFSVLAIKVLKPDDKFRSFFLYSGLFSLLLLCDDLWMFHEEVFPTYLMLPEAVVYLLYCAFSAFYILKFKRFLLAYKPGLFIAALVFFAASLALDRFISGPFIEWLDEHLLEDGFKLLGVFAWFVYFLNASMQTLIRISGLTYR